MELELLLELIRNVSKRKEELIYLVSIGYDENFELSIREQQLELLLDELMQYITIETRRTANKIFEERLSIWLDENIIDKNG